jgi:GMP synthase (glutamine-hydrolysing)
MVTERLPWSLVVARWLPSIVQAAVPFLGICYGHQLLAQAMGGESGYHPGGPEAGTVDVLTLPEANGDLLFDEMPASFDAHAVHEQTVLQLPPGAVRLACNAFEPHHAFRLGRCAWGVQFHPEYDERIMRAYLLAEGEQMGKQRMPVDVLVDTVRATPHAAGLLARFGALVEKNLLGPVSSEEMFC